MPETLLELALDGRRISSGRGHDLVDQVVELSLLPEPQLLEVFVGGRRENDSVRLGMELADGSIGRIPAAWTDPAKNAKLAELLADKAIISRTDTGFKAAFVKPERLRALRWEFTDFAGKEAEVKSLGIVDANGAAIVPVGSDYSDALGNDMLEVVPGDPIFVTYSDAATSGGEKRIIERNLSSSFHDGAVSLLFENFVEDRDGRPRRELDAAYRIRPGDALLIQVSDPDMDATPEADAVAVQVSAGDQPPLTLSAVEERDPGAPEGVETYVGGVFHALLKTVDASDAAAVAAEAVLGELELQGSPQVVREAKRLRAYLYKDRMGKFEKAIGYFNEAVDPPESLWGVQECLWRLGRKDEAQAMLGEIVGAFPKDAPRAMFQKAEYFRLDGEKASAIACYRRILSNPEWGRSGEASRATPRPSKFPVFAASPPTGRRRSCS